MKTFAFFFPLIILVTAVDAQSRLEGTWEGSMTIGGLYSDETLPVQLYLTAERGKVTGRSYVQLPDGSTLRMDLEGRAYRDGSIRLFETAFSGDEFNERLPKFNRKYQIIFKDDLWDPVLSGFWQEIKEEVFDPTRRRGRMTLRKRKVKGV